MLEDLPQLNDDGLLIPEVGSWAERKYRILWNYAKMFTTGTKNKWHERIYIDLYAGAGFARIRESSIIVPASPLLALDIPDKFDKYIFCEQEEVKNPAAETAGRQKSNNLNCPTSFSLPWFFMYFSITPLFPLPLIVAM